MKSDTDLARRLSVRISDTDYTRLCQIGLAERTRSEGETIRLLIALYWASNSAQIKREIARATAREASR